MNEQKAKKMPSITNDKEAEDFVSSDLSQYDFSSFKRKRPTAPYLI